MPIYSDEESLKIIKATTNSYSEISFVEKKTNIQNLRQ